MTSIPTGTAWRPYLRALGEAGLDVASVGAWVAAAELSPARRRLARSAVTAAIAAVAVPAFRGVADTTEPPVPGARSGLPVVDAGIRLPAEPGTASRRRVVLTGAVLTTVAAASVGATVAGRKLERRWLARLIRNGHPHPHRGLAIRMAAVYAALVVPSRLLAVRQAAKAGDPGSAENGWTGSDGGR